MKIGFMFFYLAASYKKLVLASFIPLFGPLLFAGATMLAYVKSPCSFKLWYRLKNHYAKQEDVEKMGVLKGIYYALGKYQNRFLKLQSHGRCLSGAAKVWARAVACRCRQYWIWTTFVWQLQTVPAVWQSIPALTVPG